jgi:hypothetical protein
MPNIMKLMKQVNQMQKNLAKTQEDLAARVFDHSVGGGAVVVTITGSGQIQKIKISPEAVDPSDVAGLEDLILTAVKGAQEEARQTSETEMGKLTAGLNLPPGFGL